jgi:hypothetical protein
MDQALIDQSGLYTLEDIAFWFRTAGNTSITGQPTKQPMDKLRSIDIPDLVAEEHLFAVSKKPRLYKEDKYIRIKYVKY